MALLLGLSACAGILQPDESQERHAQTAPLLPVEYLVDYSGVQKLFKDLEGGRSWWLDGNDANTHTTFFNIGQSSATKMQEGNLSYWQMQATPLTYSDPNVPAGTTLRLNITPSGCQQTDDWQNQAKQRGYLGCAQDPEHVEATVYLRLGQEGGTHKSMTWKIRGGAHSEGSPHLASCVGMEVGLAGKTPKAYRELTHPIYEYVYPGAIFDFQAQPGQWLAIKIVSFVAADKQSTDNRLYLDTEPFDAEGKPRNMFRLYMRWNDVQGESTGSYTTAATWRSFLNTMRVDGFAQVDVAHLSVREITPR